jgi:D-alanyl-D-alanine dipeptidase
MLGVFAHSGIRGRSATAPVTIAELQSMSPAGFEWQNAFNADEFYNILAKAALLLDLPPEALRNRQILEDAMVRHGFTPLPSEWWHFDYKGYEGKPNLDIPIDSLR